MSTDFDPLNLQPRRDYFEDRARTARLERKRAKGRAKELAALETRRAAKGKRSAIRTLSETDSIRVIEGLGIPFGGPFAGNSDDYGTRATRKTNFYWSLYPDRAPTDPSDVPARFTRPITYSHGFNKDLGLHRIGGWSPVRRDAQGIWIRGQIDKLDEYYPDIAPLLDRGQLFFSSGSAEHSARIAKNGDWTDWPVYELAVTPTPSNPLAVVTSRISNSPAARAALRGYVRLNMLPASRALGPQWTGKESRAAALYKAMMRIVLKGMSAIAALKDWPGDAGAQPAPAELDRAAQNFVANFNATGVAQFE